MIPPERTPESDIYRPEHGEIGWEIAVCGFAGVYTVAKLCQVITLHDDCRRIY